MLVLTRKMDQKIHLGDNITITVLRVRGNTIRLGIEAPREMRVVRGELPPLDHDREKAQAKLEAEPEMPQAKVGVATEVVSTRIPARIPSPALRKGPAGGGSPSNPPLGTFVRNGSDHRQELSGQSVLIA